MRAAALTMTIIFTVISVVWATDPMKIDFQWNFKQRAAQTLFEKKDYAGAQKAAEELAASAPDEQSRIKCLALSAVALAHQGQYDQALKKSQEIADKPVADYTRMEIMAASGKQAELIAAFKDTNLTEWPENLAYKGFLKRGEASLAVQDDKAALADLDQAAARADKDTETQLEILNKIGAIRAKLQDPDGALEAYKKIFAICAKPKAKGSARHYPPALLAAARILKDQKKYDEALKYLERLDVSLSKTSGLAAMELTGDIYAEQGKKAEAQAKYRETAELALKHDNQRVAERMSKKAESLK